MTKQEIGKYVKNYLKYADISVRNNTYTVALSETLGFKSTQAAVLNMAALFFQKIKSEGFSMEDAADAIVCFIALYTEVCNIKGFFPYSTEEQFINFVFPFGEYTTVENIKSLLEIDLVPQNTEDTLSMLMFVSVTQNQKIKKPMCN